MHIAKSGPCFWKAVSASEGLLRGLSLTPTRGITKRAAGSFLFDFPKKATPPGSKCTVPAAPVSVWAIQTPIGEQAARPVPLQGFLAGNGRERLHLRKLGPEILAIEQCEQRKDCWHGRTPSYRRRLARLCYGLMSPQDENGYVAHALCFVQSGREETRSHDWEPHRVGANVFCRCAAERRG